MLISPHFKRHNNKDLVAHGNSLGVRVSTRYINSKQLPFFCRLDTLYTFAKSHHLECMFQNMHLTENGRIFHNKKPQQNTLSISWNNFALVATSLTLQSLFTFSVSPNTRSLSVSPRTNTSVIFFSLSRVVFLQYVTHPHNVSQFAKNLPFSFSTCWWLLVQANTPLNPSLRPSMTAHTSDDKYSIQSIQEQL